MFKRKHTKLGKRKSKVSIDLNSLTKKDRKAYRQQRNERPKGKRKDKSEEEVANDEVQEEIKAKTLPPSSSASEEEEEDDDDPDADVDAYRQLVSNLGVAGTKSHKDSDEDESEEEEEEEEEGDGEGDEDTEDAAEAGVEEGDLAGTQEEGSESEGEEEDAEEDATSEEAEEDLGEDCEDEDDTLQESDPFMQHFERDLDEQVAEELAAGQTCHREEAKISGVGTAVYQWPHDKLKQKKAHRKNKDLTSLHVKKSLLSNLVTVNRKICKSKTGEHEGLTTFQHSLFSVLNNYQDLLYTSRTADNGDQIRQMYCLHALNHILKTRKQVISHNVKLKAKPDTAGDETYRDQGLTRPKVLIVCPFRESAKRVVQTFIQLLNPTDQSFVANKKRFNKEYSLPPEEEPFKGHKPEDFETTFEGNIDDHFRIGVGVARKTLKLYTKFYAADIIVASPLGLRTLIGTEEDEERDYDFLNSIELLILDQADVFMMQNWDHILHLMKHLHLQPQESHGVDFSRVRMWTINGWSRYYRQTLLFSSVPLPEINSLFNKHCHNYAGKFHVQREPTAGTICQIATQLPQVFHRIDCSSHPKMADERFEYFVKKILPHHTETLMSNTLVFLPSYFDFVRLRNYLIREGITALFVNEYSKDMTVSKARAKFFHRKIPFMLYTERYHFFRRVSIRGIGHLVFYGLPMYPHLYAEMCNMLQDKKTGRQAENQTCTVLYTRYEAAKLAEMVGTDRATQMINSKKAVHMFVTGENG